MFSYETILCIHGLTRVIFKGMVRKFDTYTFSSEKFFADRGPYNTAQPITERVNVSDSILLNVCALSEILVELETKLGAGSRAAVEAAPVSPLCYRYYAKEHPVILIH